MPGLFPTNIYSDDPVITVFGAPNTYMSIDVYVTNQAGASQPYVLPHVDLTDCM